MNKKAIIFLLLIIFIIITKYSCKKEESENKWIAKVTVNEKLQLYDGSYYDTIPVSAYDHSGVEVICQNGNDRYNAITNRRGLALIEGLPFDWYDIILKLENTQKIYCSMVFDHNLDTMHLNLYKLQKDTLSYFRYEIKNDTVFYFYFILRNADNIDVMGNPETFLYLFFNDNNHVSHCNYKAIWILYSPLYQEFGDDNITIRTDRWLMGYLNNEGFNSGDPIFFKTYAGNPNVSTCLRDGTGETYYFGFSDSTEVFGFVMP